MQIGIISDTHGSLPSTVFEHFKTVEQIFHAGDIGEIRVIEQLEKIAPVYAVVGNMDDWNLRRNFPSIYFTEIKNKKFCLVHDIGNKKKFCFELFKNKNEADIIIHGHTHRPTYEVFQNKIFINPGSSAHPRTTKKGSLAIIELNGAELNHKFIDLE